MLAHRRLANQCDGCTVGPIMAKGSFELTQVAFFGRFGTSRMNALAIDQPQLPSAGREALWINVSRRNSAPSEAGRVNTIDGSRNGPEDGVTVRDRHLSPNAAANQFGE